MFELLALLCIGDVCAERVLPQPLPATRELCEQHRDTRVQTWLDNHQGYTLQTAQCTPTEQLIERAASVTETSPGHFVHQGHLEDFLPENAGDIANTGFIVGTDAVAVIDAGTSRQVSEALYLAVRRQTSLPIRYNLITHMHPDHMLGAEVFREAGAEIVGSPKLTDALVQRNQAYSENLQRIIGELAFHGTQAVLPDRAAQNNELIELGGRTLHISVWPTAHTDNDITILDAVSSTLWMGDLVFLDHVPALDGSILGWVDLLSQLDSSTASQMVPGHGPVIAEFPAGTKPTLNYLQALMKQTRKAIAKGESLATAVKHLGKDLRGEWEQFDQYNERNATNAYVELEWE